MYKIVENARAWAPVTWPGVTEEGEQIENRIEMRFRLLDVDTNMGLLVRAAAMEVEAGKGATPTSLAALYAQFVEEIAVDWRGVGGENGEALGWSTENLTRLMSVVGTFEAVLEAYRDCAAGKTEIRRGN